MRQSKPYLSDLFDRDNSVYNCLFLLESNIWKNEREFFGFFFQTLESIDVKISWKQWRPKKPSFSQNRIRGYRDHGTLKPQHSPEPACQIKNFQQFIKEYESYQEFINYSLPGLIEGWIT